MYITGSGRDLQSILQTHRTLSYKFGDSLLLGSGTTACQSPFSEEGTIGKIDVLSYDAPCFFSEGTFSEIFSGSLIIPLLQAHFLSPWLIRALGSITECRPGSPGLCRGVKFWRRHSQVHSSAAIQISVECAGPQQHNGVPSLWTAICRFCLSTVVARHDTKTSLQI